MLRNTFNRPFSFRPLRSINTDLLVFNVILYLFCYCYYLLLLFIVIIIRFYYVMTFLLNFQQFEKTRDEKLKNQQREYEAQKQYREHLQVYKIFC